MSPRSPHSQVRGEEPDNRCGTAYRQLKARRVTSQSIGYIVAQQRKGADGVNELVELDLAEISLVARPPNPGAVVTSVRSGTDRLHLSVTDWHVTPSRATRPLDSAFTSERDHDVDVTNGLRINECGVFPVMSTNIGQGLSGQVVDGGVRLGASRRTPSRCRQRSARRPGGHLRLAAVLDADEQDGRVRRQAHEVLASGGDTEFVEEAADALSMPSGIGTASTDSPAGVRR